MKKDMSVKKICLTLCLGVVLFGAASISVLAKQINPVTDSIKKVVTVAADAQSIHWKQAADIDGYELYCAEKWDEKYYKLVRTIKDPTITSCTIKKRFPGIDYSYRIRTYKTVDGIKEYGPWSADYFAPINKYKVVYGKNTSSKQPGAYYSSAAKAKKYMKTIRVKTWDFKNGKKGKKITRYWTITVHKNLASSVKKAFNEIYNGKEKFPIHSLNAQEFRGGRTEHNDGTAIDINWEENYMISDGKIVAGKFWKPGKNPYSIPKNGEVAKIFRKYGFYQGDWGTKKDYMHFSYFAT